MLYPDFDEEVKLLDYSDKETPFGMDIEFTDSEKLAIMTDINQVIQDNEGELQNLGISAKLEDLRNQIDGRVTPKDSPFEGASNLHVPITQEKIEVLGVKADQQIFTSPFILCKPKPGADDKTLRALENKQKFINYKIYEEIDIEEALAPVNADAIGLGTGALLLYWDTKIQRVTETERYTPDDIDKFIERFKAQSSTDSYQENKKKLLLGESVTCYVSKLKVKRNRPVIEWVPLDCLKIHPTTKLEEQRCVPIEQEITWKELEEYAEAEYFSPTILEELQEHYRTDSNLPADIGNTPDYKKKPYTMVQATYLCDYDGEGMKWAKIYYLKEELKWLKGSTYPYKHNELDIFLYHIRNKGGTNFPPGIAEMLRAMNKALNELWNQTIDAGTWANSPTFKAVGKPGSDPVMKKWGPAYVWWVQDTKSVEQFPIQRTSVDMYRFIELILREASNVTGISDYASGSNTPSDPNAPASKSLMLLQESNARLMRYIKNLHKTNERLCYCIDSMYQQYYQFGYENETPEGAVKTEEFEYEGSSVTVEEGDLFTDCYFKANMSPLTINKAMQHQVNQEVIAFSAKVLPPIYQRNLKKFAELYYRGAPGEWPTYADELIKALDAPTMQPGGPGAPQQPGQPTEGAPGMPDVPREALPEEAKGLV